jgi:acetyl-CoA C-acetyltransferase
MSADKAKELGVAPLGQVVGYGMVAGPNNSLLTQPSQAILKAAAKAGTDLAGIDLFEINEAFAAMCVATVKLLELDPDKVNVSGSGCSLGHPVAATGARMLVTLVHELRRRGGGIAVAAMCAGGGMGSATVIEVAAP